MQLHKARFAIDSIPSEIFEGYTSGETWNGWACPFFEKSEAERILKASEGNRYRWTYSPDVDAFTVYSEDADEEVASEVFEGVTANLDDGREIKVYGIGARSWIWDLITEV